MKIESPAFNTTGFKPSTTYDISPSKHKIKTFISGHEHNIQFIKRIYDDYTFNQVIRANYIIIPI